MKLFGFDVKIGDWRVLTQTRDISDSAITNEKIKDGEITASKLKDSEITWPKLADDVKNIIASREEGGVALSNEFGDSELIGISQKTLTEFKEGLGEIITDEKMDDALEGQAIDETETSDTNEPFQWDIFGLKRFYANYIKTPLSGAQTSLSDFSTRLNVLEQLSSISVSGGIAGIATAFDFWTRTPIGDAKIPTVAAVIDGIGRIGDVITDTEMDTVLDGELPVYLTDDNNRAVLDDNGKPIEIV